MKAVLLIDFGSTYTKITAVDVEKEKILGTAQSFTTIETDINDGLNNALAILKEQIGEIEFSERYACSSAAFSRTSWAARRFRSSRSRRWSYSGSTRVCPGRFRAGVRSR